LSLFHFSLLFPAFFLDQLTVKWNKNGTKKISNKMLEVAVMARIQARKGKKRTMPGQSFLGSVQRLLLANINTNCVATYRDARLRVVSPSTIQKEFALLSHLFTIARCEWGLPLCAELVGRQRSAGQTV
jgi:hypothetical protein